MSNKVDNKLDFRNIKNTQFDPGQTRKMVFSEFQSADRVYQTNPILKDAYSHFIQELDINDRPNKVTYYQASSPARDRIQFRADVGGDLAGTYFTLQEFITQKTHVFYYVVSGSGSAPGIGDIETPININNNDPASVVTLSTKNILNTIDEYIVLDAGILSSYIDIEYLQFGETEAINVGTTGFMTSRIKEGSSFIVGEVELSYDVEGNPIYNGSKLKGLIFNPYTASFDKNTVEVTVVNEKGTPLLTFDEVNSLAEGASATILTYVVPVNTRLEVRRINFSGQNMGTYDVKINGSTVDKFNTYYTDYNGVVEFEDMEYSSGTVITIEVLNRGEGLADFNANLQGRLLNV